MPHTRRTDQDDRADAPAARSSLVVRLGALLCTLSLALQPLTGLLHVHTPAPDAIACSGAATTHAAACDVAPTDPAVNPADAPSPAPGGSNTDHDDRCVVCQLLASVRAAPAPSAPTNATFDAARIGYVSALSVRALTHDARTDARPRAPPTA